MWSANLHVLTEFNRLNIEVMATSEASQTPPSPIQEILNQITVTTVYQVGTLPKVFIETSWVEAALLEYIQQTIEWEVQPCEPDCTPERHAYHQGQWDMATRLAERFGIER